MPTPSAVIGGPRDPFDNVQETVAFARKGPLPFPSATTLAKVFFINEASREALPVLLNPTVFAEQVTANYARQPVLGLSHEVLQYTRTETLEIPLQLYVSSYEMARQSIRTRSPLDYRNFFLSLVYPVEAGHAPPTITFVWPGTTTIRGVITSLRFTYQRFNFETGAPLIYTIDLTVVEFRSSLRSSPVARNRGFVETDEALGPLLVTPSAQSILPLVATPDISSGIAVAPVIATLAVG